MEDSEDSSVNKKYFKVTLLAPMGHGIKVEPVITVYFSSESDITNPFVHFGRGNYLVKKDEVSELEFFSARLSSRHQRRESKDSRCPYAPTKC